MDLKELLKEVLHQEGVNFEDNYLDILNNSQDIIVYQDLDYKIVWANKRALKEFSKLSSEVIGHHCYQVVKNRDQICEECMVKKVEETGKVQEAEIHNPNGNKYLSRAYPIKNEQDELTGVIKSSLNITERKILKEQLEESKLKTKIFANLSHEFKTPLNLTSCGVQMLETKLKSNNIFAEYEKYIDIIKQNNKRLLQLITNLIDITKIDSGAYELNLQNHDLVDLIEKIVSSVKEYATSKEIKLQFKSEIESKIIACDPFNLERIILNLLSNAIKFTDAGDQIEVTIRDKDSKTLISVKDTGVGIPKDKQKNIFNRFGQADKSQARNSAGSGIGLSLVKLLVEMHGGEIYLEGEYGVGSEFIVELPAEKLKKENNQKELEKDHESLLNKANMDIADIYF
ncbi:PAS domain-containing sensor histidine kinase [Natroniella sulfidigena]|uniref:PAS domain-containing sensor histidine kinase n=1 Tax=Natroniella sulfidigena TaxID=723921 RepID=UPI00200B65B9|nr:PAS domain-containing sensor histidine kinase [Natroniella sulfidigena]MCK8817873.1 PAS domain-containing sensor histidine kinase [Natroniella sulfidigena]